MADKIDNLKKPNRRGRPPGVKNKVDPKLKASIKAVYEYLAKFKPTMLKKAIIAGIQSKPPSSFQYLQLGAHYLDGKPSDKVDHGGSVEFKWKTDES